MQQSTSQVRAAASEGVGGLQRRFALPASIGQREAVTGQGYRVTLTTFADQTGGGFLPSAVQVGYRLLTSNQQLFEITAVENTTLGSARVIVSEITGTGSEPTGSTLLYQYDGSTESIPFVPTNSTGISSALNAIIATHNAQSTQAALVGLGGGQPLNEARLRTLAADATEREVRIDTAVQIAASLTLPAHLHFDIRAGGYFQIADAADLTIHGRIIADSAQHIFRGEGRTYLGRKFTHLEWFGARPDGTMDPFTFLPLNQNYTPSAHPFRKARHAVGEGGTVQAGAGIFVMKDADNATRSRWARTWNIPPSRATLSTYLDITNDTHVCYHDVTIAGSGKGRTLFVPNAELSDDGQSTAGVVFSPYRSSGHLDTASDLAAQATYEATLQGGMVVPLKNEAMAAIFSAGQTIQVRNGGNIWDQDKCEMNIVDRVAGNLLYLKYPLQRDMSITAASIAGRVGAFTQPAEGGVVQVSYTGNNSKPLGGVDKTFSLGNNLYEVVSNDGGGLFTIRNVAGKANDPAGTEFPANSEVMKARVVYPCTTSTRGATIRDLTVVGVHDAWRFSNMIDCTVRNVEMLHSGSTDGGLSVDGDGGANMLMEYCYTRVRSGQFEGAQIARSQTNFRSRFCEWIGVKHSVVEFSYATSFYRDSFYFDARYGVKIDEDHSDPDNIIYTPATNVAAMLIGQSTGETRIERCYFEVIGAEKAIGSSDIVSFTASSGGRCHLIDNIIRVDGTQLVITLNGAGHVITGNLMLGSTESVYGSLGDPVGPGDVDSVAGVATLTDTLWGDGNVTYLKDTHFVGKVDQIFRSGPKALKARDCSVTRMGGRLGERAIDHNRVISGSLVGNNGNNYETYGVDIEMDVHGWYDVAGIDGNKFRGVLKAQDRFEFRLHRTQNYTQSGDQYTHIGSTAFTTKLLQEAI